MRKSSWLFASMVFVCGFTFAATHIHDKTTWESKGLTDLVSIKNESAKPVKIMINIYPSSESSVLIQGCFGTPNATMPPGGYWKCPIPAKNMITLQSNEKSKTSRGNYIVE